MMWSQYTEEITEILKRLSHDQNKSSGCENFKDICFQVCNAEETPVTFTTQTSLPFLLVGRKCTVVVRKTSDEEEDETYSEEDNTMPIPAPEDEQKIELEAISTTEARTLASIYIQCEANMNLIPMWVKCSGELIYLTCYGKCVQLISRKGPLDVCELETVSSLVASHKWGQDNLQVTHSGFAQYVVIDDDFDGTLKMTFAWDPVTQMLQQPSLDAKAILHILPRTGNMRSPVYSFYEELNKLQCFLFGLTGGEIHWPAVDSTQDVTHRIISLFKAVELGHERKSTETSCSEEDADAKLQAATLLFEPRTDLDFTESLWQILKECTSCKEFVQGFEFVFKVLQKGEIKPMVHTDNKCQLAKLVIDSYYNKMTPPILDNKSALSILVEIGCEKIKRDFISAFLSLGLLSLDQLQDFLDNCEQEECLQRLMNLQLILELVVLLKLYLNLPQIMLYQAVRQAMSYYKSQVIHDTHTFEIPVQATYLTATLESCTPKDWQLCLKSEDVTTIYHLTKYSKPVGDSSHNERKDSEAEMYYVTQVTSNRLPDIS